MGLVLILSFNLSCEKKALIPSAHKDEASIQIKSPSQSKSPEHSRENPQEQSQTKFSDLIAQELDIYGEDSSHCPKIEKSHRHRIESLRTYFCHLNILSLDTFETLFAEKVFKNRSKVDKDFYNHKSSFAEYNPEFLNSVKRFISNIDEDSTLHQLISRFYEKHIYNWVHLNLLVVQLIKDNPSWIRDEIQFYQLLSKNEQDIRARMMFYRDFLDPQYFSEKKVPNPSFKAQNHYDKAVLSEVVAFWVRRHIKEQDTLFESLLKEFVDKFAPEAPTRLAKWKKSEAQRFDHHRFLRRETFKRQMKKARLPASQLDLETFENLPIGEDEQL